MGPTQHSWIILPQADYPENNIVAKFISWGDMWMWEVTTSGPGIEFQELTNEMGQIDCATNIWPDLQ